MALELKNLSKRVGAETYIHETNLAFAEQGFNVLSWEPPCPAKRP